VALGHLNERMRKTAVDHGRPAPPRERGQSENHRLNGNAMGSIACMHTEIALPVGWVSAAAPAHNPTLFGRPKLLGYAPRALTQPTGDAVSVCIQAIAPIAFSFRW